MTRKLRLWHARMWQAVTPLLVVALLLVAWATWGRP